MAVGAMPLLPRWRFMTDEAKALTKRVAVSAVALVLVALLLVVMEVESPCIISMVEFPDVGAMLRDFTVATEIITELIRFQPPICICNGN